MKIAQYRVEDFLKKIATFNNKAKKLALPEVKAELVGTELKEIKAVAADGEKYSYFIQINEYDIKGDIPKVGGWAIHSKVEPDREGNGNFVFTNKGFKPVESLRTTALICQHCNTARARSCVYLLQNLETGEQKLVGKSCLKDFLPQTNILEVLSYLESLHKLDAPFDNTDEEGEYVEGSNLPRAAWVYPVDLLVAESLVVIRKYGYVSKKAVREFYERTAGEGGDICETSSLLANTGRNREKIYSVAEIKEVTESGQVEACIEWIKSQPAKTDFFYNLQLAIKQAGAPWKLFGFVAAGVNFWLRHLEAEVAKTTKVEKLNEHVGAVGERREFHNLKITREFVTQGQFASVFITTLEDEEGRTYKWFASKRVGEVGEVVNLKATVKKHDEFKGTKETVITRGVEI